MTLNDIIEILKKNISIPIRYRVFRGPISAPYLVYYSESSNNFGADNSVYQRRDSITLELYTKIKDIALEESLEEVLDNNEIYWEKYEDYIDSEKLFQISYELE
jgi:hypothetical protein